MCGINFILDKKGVLDGKPIHQMNHATQHRGPDHSGFYNLLKDGKNLYFAASRLKIMDLSDNANQPFVSEDGNYILVFNGEIYNYHDIKNTLLHKGYTFKSSSDTEVLFHALIESGDRIIKKLNGMFALIFYDRNNDRLFFARDRAGMKPLFYYEDDLFLIASSEIKGILASGLVKKELDEQQIPHYLKFRVARKPSTFFKNIFELEEGRIICKTGHNTEIDDYDSYIQKDLTPIHDAQLIEKVEETIYEAFLRHTIADVPLGLFLSGGVDSTLLLALAQRERKSLPTFSIIHEENTRSYGTMDGLYSRLAVKKFGNSLDHHEIIASPDILNEVDDLIGQMDQPIGDSAALLTWFLSRYAKNMVKTVLSGTGADEFFAGYNRHHAFYHYLKHHKALSKLVGYYESLCQDIADRI
jgi:asparagine synthase (glutamine-hydrolysing)